MPAYAGMTALFLFLPSLSFATRIVSLAPVATEFVFALDLGSELVGVTTYCDKPAAAQKIAKIGGFADPQLEAILKLKPDLVVATPFGAAKIIVATLKERGIRVVSHPVESRDDMRKFLTELAAATGQVQKGAALQKKLDSEFASLKGKLKSSPRVLVLLSTSPLIGAGPSTFIGQIVEHIGARNWSKPSSAAWPVLSLEALIQDPPDVIVLSNGEKSLEDAKHHLDALLKRHPKMRIFAPKDLLLQRPGPYLNDDVKTLIEGLSGLHGRMDASLRWHDKSVSRAYA